jgi:F-type H+-transporting ATPase subunit b
LKRFIIAAAVGILLGLAVPGLRAQESGHESAAKEEAKHETHGDLWKIANFVLLAGALGYLIGKKAGPFFQSRTLEIRKGIDEAAKLKADADARYREMAERLDRLDIEVAAIREQASAENAAEAERLRQETQRDLGKVRRQGEREIDAAAKVARQELRAYSAQLAVELAEQRIRERMDPAAQEVLIGSMLTDFQNKVEGRRDQVEAGKS